jgi:thiamine pyrophosphokinase
MEVRTVRAVVVAGGQASEQDRRHLAGAELVVAADGGARWLISGGSLPDLLVGDLDSCDAELVATLESRGVRIERHPAEKEASDTELALGRAVELGADEVTIIGAFGGERLDHELANALMLSDPAWIGRRLRMVRDGTSLQVMRGGERLALRGSPGDLVTLLALSEAAQGVVTHRLRYALNGESLEAGRSRGLSNEVAGEGASVSLERGTLLVVETAVKGEQGGT